MGDIDVIWQDAGSSMARARALVVLENHSGAPYLTDRTRERFVDYHRSRAHSTTDQMPGEAGADVGDGNALVGDDIRPVERTHKLLVRPPSPVTLEKLLQKGELKAGKGALLIEDKAGALVAADLTPDALVVVPSDEAQVTAVSGTTNGESAAAPSTDAVVATPSMAFPPLGNLGSNTGALTAPALVAPTAPPAPLPGAPAPAVATPVSLVDAVSNLRGRKLSERGNSSWPFVRVKASGFSLDCYQTGKLVEPLTKTEGTSSASSSSSSSGDGSSTCGGSSKRGGLGTVEGVSSGCIAMLSGTDTEFNRLLPQRRLKAAAGTTATDKGSVDVHAATTQDKLKVENDTTAAAEAAAAAEKAAAEKAARTKKKRKVSINEIPSATVAAPTATVTAATSGSSSSVKSAAQENGVLVALQKERTFDSPGASSGPTKLPPSGNHSTSSSGAGSGNSTVALAGAKKKRSKSLQPLGAKPEDDTGVEQDLQMNEAAKLLGHHWLRPPSPESPLSSEGISPDAAAAIFATTTSTEMEIANEAAVPVVSSSQQPPPPPSSSSSLPVFSAETNAMNVLGATQDVPPAASSGSEALGAITTLAAERGNVDSHGGRQGGGFGTEAIVSSAGGAVESVSSVSSLPLSAVESTETNNGVKKEETAPVAAPTSAPSLGFGMKPGDFSSPFLRACACCKGGYQPQRQHKLLGSWPVWDDGYFSSHSDDDNDDGTAKCGEASSSGGGGNGGGATSGNSSGNGGDGWPSSGDNATGVAGPRPRRSREASSTSLGARLCDLESLDPHVMIAPEPYEVKLLQHLCFRGWMLAGGVSHLADFTLFQMLICIVRMCPSLLDCLPLPPKQVPTPDLNQRLRASEEPPGSVQPFAVHVHPDVAFVCDFHAHLADSEIIGLLGGYWDRDNRTIFIQAPFPCRSTERADDGATDVEMDPASEIAIRDIIASHGMQVVGWYHSHPKFQPDPSVTDIVNQKNYQVGESFGWEL